MAIGLGANQNQPEVTVNQQNHGYIDIDVAGTGTIVLTDFQATYAQIELSGALTGNRTVEVSDAANIIHFYNNTTGAFTVTIQPTGGSGATLTQGTRSQFGFDGNGNGYKLTAEL